MGVIGLERFAHDLPRSEGDLKTAGRKPLGVRARIVCRRPAGGPRVESPALRNDLRDSQLAESRFWEGFWEGLAANRVERWSLEGGSGAPISQIADQSDGGARSSRGLHDHVPHQVSLHRRLALPEAPVVDRPQTRRQREPDKVLQDLFDQGRQVGEAARALFPEGVLIAPRLASSASRVSFPARSRFFFIVVTRRGVSNPRDCVCPQSHHGVRTRPELASSPRGRGQVAVPRPAELASGNAAKDANSSRICT